MQPEFTLMEGKIGISGSLDFRDKDGNLLKTITFDGSLPLTNLTTDKDIVNGSNRSE